MEDIIVKEPKIEIKDLNFYYSDFHALKNIDLNIYEKEVTAFIGPSGCGKSTILRTLNRINDLIEGTRVEGKVLLDGEDIYQKDFDIIGLRTKVGMVFQKPNPFPMSIYDNVAYGPRLNGIKHKSELNEIVEKSIRAAALWTKSKTYSTAMH